MADLILHHYPTSPFAEKARLMLGYKKLSWKSVMIPVVMPKPDLTALTGGYRKTPVLQIGADIYCDTALIADVLERLRPAPAFFSSEHAGLDRVLAQWADSTLFWTAVPYTMQPAGVAYIFGDAPPEQLKAFAADRAAFAPNVTRLRGGDATGHVLAYAERINAILTHGKPYLLGDAPCIADFSVYHALWFVHRAPPMAAPLAGYTHIAPWMARMQAVGHGQSEKMSSADALAVAAAGEPMALPPFTADLHGCAAGDRVSVTPTDTGHDPVEGELVLSAANEIAVRRNDPRAGNVVVHFPRIGFQMKKLGQV